MMQVSAKLRRSERGYEHWCNGCGEVHTIFDSWQFDGNVECPTFSPSVKITGKQTVKDGQGRWTGEWVLGPDGNALDDCCHYNVTAGRVIFHGDCVHALAGHTVDLPDLPDFLTGAALSPVTPPDEKSGYHQYTDAEVAYARRWNENIEAEWRDRQARGLPSASRAEDAFRQEQRRGR